MYSHNTENRTRLIYMCMGLILCLGKMYSFKRGSTVE